MCRLLAYLGSPILLDRILTKPEHSLVVQSYQPREMNSGLLNADGFGIGWYHAQKDAPPFTYKNILPIWNDTNLSSLGRYVESRCILGAVRSATSGQAVDLSNCQPFEYQQLLCVHNGRIESFRETLARPLRDRLSDNAYKSIKGSTDSEHFFALIIEELHNNPTATITKAMHNALLALDQLVKSYDTTASANMIVTDGQQLVASRFATNTQTPSLYWLRDDPTYPESIVIASEPLFAGNWHPVAEQSILSVGQDLNVQITQV